MWRMALIWYMYGLGHIEMVYLKLQAASPSIHMCGVHDPNSITSSRNSIEEEGVWLRKMDVRDESHWVCVEE